MKKIQSIDLSMISGGLVHLTTSEQLEMMRLFNEAKNSQGRTAFEVLMSLPEEDRNNPELLIDAVKIALGEDLTASTSSGWSNPFTYVWNKSVSTIRWTIKALGF
jgi:hypothetical protein